MSNSPAEVPRERMRKMENFVYKAPTEVVFGPAAEDRAGEMVRKYGGTKVLILYGGGSVQRSGLLVRVEQRLTQEGIGFVEMGGVVPNPRLSFVNRAIALCRKEGIDFLLAVGGGSVIDTAKAVGYGAADGGDVWDFYDHKRTPVSTLPVGTLLTIAAAGSEMSDSSVITNEEGWIKRGYSSDVCRPVFSLLNPCLTMTLPPFQTACGCADILMHTMERYFNRAENMELTDEISEGLMRTVVHNAQILCSEPENYSARAEVMWAGSLSHNGLTGCGTGGGDWSVHQLEHELSGLFDVAHGAGLTAIWGSWARYVYGECPRRFAQFAEKVWGVAPGSTDNETALRGIEAAEAFFHALGLPTSLRQLGLDPTEEQISLMARKCGAACGGQMGAIRTLRPADMESIYRAAK